MMDLAQVRELALTVFYVGSALGIMVTAAVGSWRVLLFMNERIERERAITKVLAEFPRIVDLVATMTTTLASMATRLDTLHDTTRAAASAAGVAARAATAESSAASEERERVQDEAPRAARPRRTAAALITQ